MDLVKVQWQLRYPYPGNPDGYYYWTTAQFKNVPDPTDFTAYIPDMETVLYKTLLYEAQVNWIRVQSPPEQLPPLEDAYSFNHPGETDYPGPSIIENCARVSLYVGEEYVGYRMLRATVATPYIIDDLIRADVRDRIQTEYADAMIANEQTTRDGRLLTSAVVSPRIHRWALRHGTKRRQRGVIHNP